MLLLIEIRNRKSIIGPIFSEQEGKKVLYFVRRGLIRRTIRRRPGSLRFNPACIISDITTVIRDLAGRA
jgi:hypothetical protein